MSAPTRTEWMVLQQISAELREAGYDVPADALAWTRERFGRLMARRARERDLADVRRRTADWQHAHGCGGAS